MNRDVTEMPSIAPLEVQRVPVTTQQASMDALLGFVWWMRPGWHCVGNRNFLLNLLWAHGLLKQSQRRCV